MIKTTIEHNDEGRLYESNMMLAGFLADGKLDTLILGDGSSADLAAMFVTLVVEICGVLPAETVTVMRRLMDQELAMVIVNKEDGLY